MSRGKYRRRRAGRTERAQAATITHLTGRISAEQQRLERARVRAAATAAARERLERETQQARRRLAPAETDAADSVQRIALPWQQLRRSITHLHRVDQHLTAASGPSSGGGRARLRARIEDAVAAGIPVTPTDIHRCAPESYRTHRTANLLGPDHTDIQLTLEGWIPDPTPTDRASLARYAESTARDTTPEAGYTWAIPPWLAHPDGHDAPQLRALLGATTTGAPQPPDPTTTYQDRLPARAAITLPWRNRPLIPDPHDAVDLAHWYQRSATAQHWPPPTPHAAKPGGPGVDDMVVPFWLPPEFSHTFPQARPLPDSLSLRLPFPAVFACFASSWQLPAHPDHHSTDSHPDDESVSGRWPYAAMLHARGRAIHRAPPTLADVLRRLQAVITDRTHLPTPLQLAAELGARVEGLILTAHPDGTPRDDFAWCLAIHHPWGVPLARVLIPASRTTTAWQTPVDNILAAIALSSWHPNPHPPHRTHNGQGQPDPPDHAGRPQVRVLDIDTTTAPTRPHPQHGHTSSPQPHLRRGHWRRQRTGPGRRHTRWTWIRPTTVNTTNGTPATTIYRLPPPTPPP